MPPKVTVTPDEDVKFLLTIIKLVGIGTPDWEKVADELDLPSKGAAAKRFSRLPNKYGMEKPEVKAASASPGATETPKKSKAKKATGSAKKRKIAESEVEAENGVDADDGEAAVKAEEDD